MALPTLARDLSDCSIHLTGVKGSGMAALAELLRARGATLSGSDVADRFHTDAMLERIGLRPRVGFAARHLPPRLDLLVHSAAYPADNPERCAARVRGIPQLSYHEALGVLSRMQPTLAVSGVHGKTTTTAMIGTIARDLAVTVLVGGAVIGFGGAATLRGGYDAFVVEACEYRRHFLSIQPTVLLVTSIEADHLDYFRDADDVHDAFVEMTAKLPPHGCLVYCADDPGARRLAQRMRTDRPELGRIGYGFSRDADVRLGRVTIESGLQRARLHMPDVDVALRLTVPGRHNLLNAGGALTALHRILGGASDVSERVGWARRLAGFRGTKRRSEVLSEVGGVVVMDDYAHHPSAIEATLRGLREFYGRRILVDFMSHTYSRSAALVDEFATAFHDAAVLVVNDIYASARERAAASIDSADFARRLVDAHPDAHYRPDFGDAARYLATAARPGDIVLTMGAGDNFRVAERVVQLLEQRERA